MIGDAPVDDSLRSVGCNGKDKTVAKALKARLIRKQKVGNIAPLVSRTRRSIVQRTHNLHLKIVTDLDVVLAIGSREQIAQPLCQCIPIEDSTILGNPEHSRRILDLIGSLVARNLDLELVNATVVVLGKECSIFELLKAEFGLLVRFGSFRFIDNQDGQLGIHDCELCRCPRKIRQRIRVWIHGPPSREGILLLAPEATGEIFMRQPYNVPLLNDVIIPFGHIDGIVVRHALLGIVDDTGTDTGT